MLSTATNNHNTAATAPVKIMNHMHHHQKPDKTHKAAQHQQPAPNEDSFKTYQNLFVACLPRSLTDKSLLALFASFNPTHAAIMMDVATGRSKGFGFVTFATEEEGQAAATALSGQPVKSGRTSFTMHISPSKHNGTAVINESNFVYIRNFPAGLRADEIRDVLARFGVLLWLQVRPDDKQPDSQLVMAEYGSVEEAARVIRELHRTVPFPRLSKLPLMAKFADPGAVVVQRRTRVPTEAAVLPPYSAPECSAEPQQLSSAASETSTCELSLSRSQQRSASEVDSTEGSFHNYHQETAAPISAPALIYRNDPYTRAGFIILAC